MEPENKNSDSPNSFDINALLRALLEQNRLREQQMDVIVKKLLGEKKTEVSVPSLSSYHIHTVPMFDGETGDTDLAAEWLNALKTAAMLNKWPDMSTLEAGRSRLEGAARNWHLSHMLELDSFEKFGTAFEATFTSQESITETWKKMSEQLQQPDETVFA